ncbi:uncharacterized protein [Atheta coriaria]|uniref:uncharacterized protein n=1 Tax=Dalotia coriaria TaxID=877792 RepID=UPI0031F4555E
MEETRWRTSVIFWCLLLLFAALTFLYNLAEVKNLANSGAYVLTHSSDSNEKKAAIYTEEAAVKGYLIKTPGCTIPDLKAMDPLIKKYIFREKPVVCNKGLPPLYEANRTAIYRVEDAFEQYKITDVKKLTCCYQYFHRATPGVDQSDKKVQYDEQCHLVEGSAYVHPDEEFLRVKCQYDSNEIYKDFFSFVPIKNDSRAIPIVKNNTTNTTQPTSERLNVLVIGIDAVSRLNFHRQMPKTAFYLEKLNAVELLGYNKIGDNTYPNLIAALTGHDETEVQKLCWPTEDAHFDNCSFIWKDYKRAGYTTAFGEDSAWMGLFYYTKRGFRNKPTDYFYDHFDITATNEVGNNHRLNVDQCLGSRQTYMVFLDYINNFVMTMAEAAKPFFGFFWTSSLSHDFLNKPKLGDQDYMNILFNLDEEGILNKTALLVISDHGIRWGDIRSTYQGRMEERLPFVYIVLPQWYRESHVDFDRNLKTNVRRLTTPFDLHETFIDLLHPERHLNTTTPRGVSLFREISKNRTCAAAGIAQHWCTCQNSVNIDTTTDVVVQAVNHTVQHINNLLIGYADCLTLKLVSIEDARELTNDNELKEYTRSTRDFTVTFKTEPGGAIFEATVRREEMNSNTPNYTVTGTVSRINLYGEQSRCITDFHLKLYCYCRSYVGN